MLERTSHELALCLALATGAVSATDTPPAQKSPPTGLLLGEPPPGTRRMAAPSRSVFAPDLEASVLTFSSKGTIDVSWRYSPTGDFQKPHECRTESFAVDYWPTACEATADQHVIVAGKRSNGNTCIERWTLKKPLIRPDGGGGVFWSSQGRSEVVTLYDAAQAGKDIVRGVVRKRGAADRVLVHFHDSRDLYELDASQAPATMKLLLSHSDEPTLLGDFDTYGGGDHSRHGYVYCFASIDRPGAVTALLLKDSDRNGTIEWHGAISGAQWGEQFEARSNYIEYNGR